MAGALLVVVLGVSGVFLTDLALTVALVPLAPLVTCLLWLGGPVVVASGIAGRPLVAFIGLKAEPAARLVFFFVFGMAIHCAFYPTILLAAHAVPLWTVKLKFSVEPGLTAVVFVTLGYIAKATAEEVLFRGYLQNRLVEYGAGPRSAILTAAVCFAASHWNSGLQIVFAFPVGIILGCVFARTRSLALAIAVHAGINSFTFASKMAPIWKFDFPPVPLAARAGAAVAILLVLSVCDRRWRVLGTSVPTARVTQ